MELSDLTLGEDSAALPGIGVTFLGIFFSQKIKRIFVGAEARRVKTAGV
jgi:hypothetical protein